MKTKKKSLKKIPKSMVITLTKKHLAKAKGYLDHTNCILGTALHEQFPGRKIIVLGFTVLIGTKRFAIQNPFSIQDYYHNPSLLPQEHELKQIGN
jgi:hypothetical protein